MCCHLAKENEWFELLDILFYIRHKYVISQGGWHLLNVSLARATLTGCVAASVRLTLYDMTQLRSRQVQLVQATPPVSFSF